MRKEYSAYTETDPFIQAHQLEEPNRSHYIEEQKKIFDNDSFFLKMHVKEIKFIDTDRLKDFELYLIKRKSIFDQVISLSRSKMTNVWNTFNTDETELENITIPLDIFDKFALETIELRQKFDPQIPNPNIINYEELTFDPRIDLGLLGMDATSVQIPQSTLKLKYKIDNIEELRIHYEKTYSGIDKST